MILESYPLKRYSRLLLITGSIIFLFSTCRKKGHSESSPKNILSFSFLQSDNPLLGHDYNCRISNDTIYIELPTGTNVTNLVPTITHNGVSITPASKTAQNYTAPVLYTVKGADGSTKTYKTVTRYLSGSKQIMSFVLEKNLNAGLSADVVGIITGDSILINVPGSANIASLIPTIVYTGASISPSNQQAVNFTFPVTYTVTAEDGSTRNYTVFANANKYIIVQGEDGYLYNLNAANGSVIWRYSIASRGCYSFHNGVVFVATNDNTVYALNIADGSVKWTSAPPAGNFIFTQPVIRNGKIYFGGEGYLNYPNSNYAYHANFVYAINETTGASEWIRPFNVQYNSCCNSINVAVDQNVVCAYDPLLGMMVLNANTGDSLWYSYYDLLGRCNPVILNNTIYFTSENGLKALGENNGSLRWQANSHYLGQTVIGNIIYSMGGQNLYANDLQTGAVIWQVSNLNNPFSIPSVNSNSVFTVLNGNHYLISYNAQNGNMNWQLTGGYNDSYLVAANNDLYLYTTSNKLCCLDAATGNTKWTATALPGFTKPFFIVDGQNNLFHITDSGERN